MKICGFSRVERRSYFPRHLSPQDTLHQTSTTATIFSLLLHLIVGGHMNQPSVPILRHRVSSLGILGNISPNRRQFLDCFPRRFRKTRPLRSGTFRPSALQPTDCTTHFEAGRWGRGGVSPSCTYQAQAGRLLRLCTDEATEARWPLKNIGVVKFLPCLFGGPTY